MTSTAAGQPEPIAIDLQQPWRLLANWAEASERWWYDLPPRSQSPAIGCYGTGYNHWGLQSNLKYVAAMTTLATHPQSPLGTRQPWALDRARSAFRFALATHQAREGEPDAAPLTDGQRWGLTWISALAIERMMHAMPSLEPHLTDADRDAWQRILLAEADWLLNHYVKGKHSDIVGDPWDHTGKNVPESNIWNGCFLWRIAETLPDHPAADDWRERAHRFLINGISIAADAHDDRIVAGRPVRERFAGANFFDHYALDHHGYCNVGYMVICHSNAAMLHFDLKAAGHPTPQTLHHHQRDLWQVVRRLIFADGRLARIGGDSRVRYAYCQEFLVPALLYAAECFDEPDAAALLQNQIHLMQREADDNNDGTFYSRRLAHLAQASPYYYTRLESDRACALSQLITYAPLTRPTQPQRDADQPAVEAALLGNWHDPDHGDVVHRCPTRFASVSWHAHTVTQTMCQPPDDGGLCDWQDNLTGRIRFAGDDDHIPGPVSTRRQTRHHHIHPFDGGFVTAGCVREGLDLILKDGWKGSGLADHHLAFAALPDGHTLVALQYARTLDKRAFALEVRGLNLGLLNDLYNNRRRSLTTASQSHQLTSPPDRDQRIGLNTTWANVDGRLGVVGLYGSRELTLRRFNTPQAGSTPELRSMFIEQLNWHCQTETQSFDPNETILDVGWAVLSAADESTTRRFADQPARSIRIDHDDHAIRGLVVQGLDDRRYLVLANFGTQPFTAEPDTLQLPPTPWHPISTPDPILPPGHAHLWHLPTS